MDIFYLKQSIISILHDGTIRPLFDFSRILRLDYDKILCVINQLISENYIRCEIHKKTNYYVLNNLAIIENDFTEFLCSNEYYKKKVSRLDRDTCFARTCFGHLAGKIGVKLRNNFIKYSFIEMKNEDWRLTKKGKETFKDLGITFNTKKNFIKNCLDGTERHYHFGGELGRKITCYFFEKKWIKKMKSGRAVILTRTGQSNLEKFFHLKLIGE